MRRYPATSKISSSLNPIDDVLVLLEYLTAKDYLRDVLRKNHGFSYSEATKRLKPIIAHIRIALSYIEQSRESTAELAFLPAYYGILNILKAYVLFGPFHRDLPRQRWHGASYPVEAKDSQTVLTEIIDLKKGGALPLFYKTITRSAWPSPTQIRMDDIYPYIKDISAEYQLATGHHSKVMSFQLGTKPHREKEKCIATARLIRRPGDSSKYALRDFKALRLFRKDKSDPSLFIGRGQEKRFSFADESYRAQFRPFLIYSVKDNFVRTPCCSSRLLMIEELPIALLFFHMSSVVRYKPEFLEKIRNSRHWPILAASRKHCILRFLILAWQYFHWENLEIYHEMT